MRALFTLYLLMITAGLAYAVLVGLAGR